MNEISEFAVWKLLEEVPDPEVPVVSIVELGIVRSVSVQDEGITVVVTPTYSGCPATKMIEMDIYAKLKEAGYTTVKINTVLAPAWTTDWMSAPAREKLRAYGIAPPQGIIGDKITALLNPERNIACPHCNSTNTRQLSEFGSTACKALWKCDDCWEPFDYFKCH